MILVVDDNSEAADVLTRLLRRSGMEATATSSGAGTLDYLRSEPPTLPSLIILDVAMPEMSGIECLRAIRDEPRWDDVPVIMYSADFGLDRMKEALRLGAAEYVVKGTARWPDFLALIHKHDRPAAPCA